MIGDAWRRGARKRPFVFGHRGVRGTLPENTMAAFDRAIDDGADGVELDVRRCKSGEVVVLHDPDLARVTDRRDTRFAADLTWDELRSVDVGGGPPPLLSDVLAWARRRRVRLNVELKHDEPRRLLLARAVARLLRTFDGKDRSVLVSSFDPLLLRAFHALEPDVAVAFLFHRGQEKYVPWRWPPVVGAVAAHPERTMVSRERVEAAKRRGLVVNVWTVNDPREALDLAALGVDGLITDRPADLLAAFASS